MTLPLEELGRHDGFEVVFADAGDSRHRQPSVTLADLQGYDVIVAQKWNKHDGLQVWRRARTPRSRLVYDLDDDLWNITPENFSAWQLYGRGDIRDAVGHAAAVADLVTVSTEPLAQVLREVVAEHGNPDQAVTVLPNCIPRRVLDLPPRQMRDRPRVGWAGGASHGVDIGIAADPVRRFLKRFPRWDLQLNGTDYRPTFRVRRDRAFYVKWTQVNEDPDGYYAGIDYDIGLAPIHPTAFAMSKSGLRALEHGARGIPVIASDVPAYRAVITHGTDGLLVKRDHEWLAYLSELASDDGLRAKMGQAARAMAARHTVEEHWARWAGAYGSLFRR